MPNLASVSDALLQTKMVGMAKVHTSSPRLDRDLLTAIPPGTSGTREVRKCLFL